MANALQEKHGLMSAQDGFFTAGAVVGTNVLYRNARELIGLPNEPFINGAVKIGGGMVTSQFRGDIAKYSATGMIVAGSLDFARGVFNMVGLKKGNGMAKQNKTL